MSRKVFVIIIIDETFATTVKKEFEIDVHEEIIVQKFDSEWQEYVDIDDLEGVKDRSNLSDITFLGTVI